MQGYESGCHCLTQLRACGLRALPVHSTDAADSGIAAHTFTTSLLLRCLVCSPEAMSPLVGVWTASTIALVVRLGYLLSIIGSAILLMFPLRQAVLDLLLGSANTADTLPVADISAANSGKGGNDSLIDTDGTTTSSSGGAAQANDASHEVNDPPVAISSTAETANIGRAWWDRDTLFAPVTLGLFAAAFLLASAIPSIWCADAFSSSTVL
jgi:hypothetical protein